MFGKFLRDESGATAIEYSLIAGFIALAIIAAVGMTGQRLVELFESLITCADALVTAKALSRRHSHPARALRQGRRQLTFFRSIPHLAFAEACVSGFLALPCR